MIPSWPFGVRVCLFDEIDSTNEEALRRYRCGERGPLWIVARSQTAGRGRYGRSWISPAGNLHATFLSHVPVDLVRAGQLALVSGLAMHRTVSEILTGKPTSSLLLKWPNDVLLEGRKISGILVETLGSPDPFRPDSSGQGCFLAIGFGLNLTQAPHDQVHRPAGALSDFGVVVSPLEALHRLARHVNFLFDDWREGGGFSALCAAWKQNAWRLGEEIALRVGGRVFVGIFSGLDENGALQLILPDGTLKVFHAGEVEVRVERESSLEPLPGGGEATMTPKKESEIPS